MTGLVRKNTKARLIYTRKSGHPYSVRMSERLAAGIATKAMRISAYMDFKKRIVSIDTTKYVVEIMQLC